MARSTETGTPNTGKSPTASKAQSASLLPSLRQTPPVQPSATAQTPALPPSLLQQPAKPAQIQFSAGKLTINADNASLGEILHAVATQSGMQIQGLGTDERVFGSFGPGSPKEVLSDLLKWNSIQYFDGRPFEQRRSRQAHPYARNADRDFVRSGPCATHTASGE